MIFDYRLHYVYANNLFEESCDTKLYFSRQLLDFVLLKKKNVCSRYPKKEHINYKNFIFNLKRYNFEQSNQKLLSTSDLVSEISVW